MTGVELGGVALVLVVLGAALGGAVQSTLGFGGSYIMVPVIAVVAPEALPAAVLVGLFPLTVGVAARDHRAIDRHAVVRITVGRIPGIALGTYLVAVASVDVLTLVVGIVLLLGVAAQALGWSVRITPTTQAAFGFVSGFSGTAAALGGPPLAILYRDAKGDDRRATMSVVFVIGIVLALTGLGLAGEFDAGDLPTGGIIGASLLGGALLMSPLVRRFSDDFLRKAVMVWAAVGAVPALLRPLLR